MFWREFKLFGIGDCARSGKYIMYPLILYNTRECRGIQENTREYKGIKGNTREYRGIQRNTREYTGLEEITSTKGTSIYTILRDT